MRKTLYSLMGTLVAFVLAPVANADIVNSSAGLATCIFDDSGNVCTPGLNTVAIGTHPLWEPNNPSNPGAPGDTSAYWISYAQTGYQGTDFVPYKGQIPVFRVIHSFSGNRLKLHAWADDTVKIWLDEVAINVPIFTQDICADQPTGCESRDMGEFDITMSRGGQHVLWFDVYQVGTGGNTTQNPMGLMYTGASVPDGGMTLMLLGGALVGLETLRRRLRA